MTQKEIADTLGVSRTTVARALREGSSINPETRDKIIEFCKKVGYKKDYIGTLLGNKTKKRIYAFLVKSKNQYYLDEILAGIDTLNKEMERYNFYIEAIVTDISNPKEQLVKLETILKYNTVSGIIITPLLKDEIKDLLKDSKHIPTISLNGRLSDGVSFIGSDYKMSGEIIGGIFTKLASSRDKIILLEPEDDNISSRLYIQGFSRRLEKEGFENIDRVHIKNLRTNLDELLSIKDIHKAKYIYVSRYVDKVTKFLADSNLTNLSVIANGFDKNTKELMMDNKIIVSTKENYFLQAYLAGKFILNLINGDQRHVNFTTKTDIVFKENLNQIEEKSNQEIFKIFNLI